MKQQHHAAQNHSDDDRRDHGISNGSADHADIVGLPRAEVQLRMLPQAPRLVAMQGGQVALCMDQRRECKRFMVAVRCASTLHLRLYL